MATVPPDNISPRITYAVLAYNQEQYVREAVESAFAQDYSPLEIILSDDYSNDHTFEVMQEVAATYHGPHRLIINRNARNLGLCGHLNALIKKASGEMIVLAAGDDISFPHRVASLVSTYLSAGKPLLVHSKALEIDEDGILTGAEAPPLLLRNRRLGIRNAALADSIYLGASGAYSRVLFEKYGPIKYVGAWEDLVLGFRAVLEGRIAYRDECLLYYRVRSGGLSQQGASLRERIRFRKQWLQMFVDVHRQRKLDLQSAALSDRSLVREINKGLDRAILQLKIRQALWGRWRELTVHFATMPLLSLFCLAKESRWLVRLCGEYAGLAILRTSPWSDVTNGAL